MMHSSWLPVVRRGDCNTDWLVTQLHKARLLAVMDVSDDALELAASGSQGGPTGYLTCYDKGC